MPERHDLVDADTVAALLASVGGDREFLAELVRTYESDASTLVDSMRAALVQQRADLLMQAAHTLKSSSASLGALGLAERCRALEAQARAGDLGATGQVDLIEQELGEVQVELQSIVGSS